MLLTRISKIPVNFVQISINIKLNFSKIRVNYITRNFVHVVKMLRYIPLITDHD